MPSDSVPSTEATDIPGTSKIRTESESSDKSGPRFLLPGTPNSPPKVLSLDEVQDVVKNIKNMALAHEIAVNNEFKLEVYEPAENSIEKVIKDTMHRAFWDVFRVQLDSTPPVYDHAIVLLDDIKEAFKSIFLENNQKVMEKINEMLDTDLVKQQAVQGTIDFKAYSNFIIHIMSLACAPIRDEAVAKLREIDDIVDLFRGILETLALMKLDMANCLLAAARNEVITNSVTYEKQKFKEYLEYYKEGFPITESWLKRHLPRADDPSAVSAATSIASDTKAKETIFKAYIDLLSWNLAESDFPEFFAMDRDRLVLMQTRVLRISVAASVVAIASGFPIISQNAESKKTLAQEITILLNSVNSVNDLPDILESIFIHVKTYINKKLTETSQRTLDDESELTLKNHILKLSDVQNSPVRSLMWKRLFTYVQLVMKVNATVPPPPGYVELMTELEAIGNAFKRVTYYNYAVYGEFYQEILSKINTESSISPIQEVTKLP